ncbi:MAG: hypothetical protein AB1551_04955, partial [Actinomycetota bacterium]
CVEVWEVLEDLLIVRANALDQIVRSVRGRAQRRAPTGRLGLAAAAFWEGYWQETASEQESQPSPEQPSRTEDDSKDHGEPPRRARAVTKSRACKGAATKAKVPKAAQAPKAPKAAAPKTPSAEETPVPPRPRRRKPPAAG